MKNNTKIRLHLSKQLFETLTKQVLAEAKANDGYTVAVKQPKQAGETKAQKDAPEVKSTDKMKKMEEKMSSKEKMAKGLYKETDDMEEMETKVAEGGLDEISSEMDLLQQAAPILGTILGVGGTFLATYVKALKSAKTPEEKEKLKQAIRNQMNKSKGF
jgi:hypothetical protein